MFREEKLFVCEKRRQSPAQSNKVDEPCFDKQLVESKSKTVVKINKTKYYYKYIYEEKKNLVN